MALGENIYRLRTERGLSQEDLSARMNVSRQSISKWENNASVPELERLVQMADIFGVSLDALVKGEDGPSSAGQGPEAAVGQAPGAAGGRVVGAANGQGSDASPAERGISGTQRVLGGVFLIAGVLVILFFFLLGTRLFSLVMGAPFLVCGVLCLTVRRRAGLWCGWAVWMMVEVYLHWATGLRWNTILLTHLWEPSWNYTRLAVAWGMALCPIVLILCTAYSFRGIRAPFGGKTAHYLAGWAVTGAVQGLSALLTRALVGRLGPGAGEPLGRALSAALFWLQTLSNWVTAALLCVMLAWTFALLRQRRERGKEEKG